MQVGADIVLTGSSGTHCVLNRLIDRVTAEARGREVVLVIILAAEIWWSWRGRWRRVDWWRGRPGYALYPTEPEKRHVDVRWSSNFGLRPYDDALAAVLNLSFREVALRTGYPKKLVDVLTNASQ